MISLKKHIQQRAMSKLRASPFTPRAKEIADPFPLNGERAWGPKESAPAAQRYYPAHSQPACLHTEAWAQSSDHHNELCFVQR